MTGLTVVLMLAALALAFGAQYAARRHARENRPDDREGPESAFAWPLAGDLRVAREVRRVYGDLPYKRGPK